MKQFFNFFWQFTIKSIIDKLNFREVEYETVLHLLVSNDYQINRNYCS
jgi:hypothetical protein